MHAYAAHGAKECFDVNTLDLAKVARAFGFASPPKIELNLAMKVRKPQPKQKSNFTSENPYAARAKSGDSRQFSR